MHPEYVPKVLKHDARAVRPSKAKLFEKNEILFLIR